jgi:hypothetical protein
MDPRWQRMRDRFRGLVLLPDVRRLTPEAAAVLVGHCDQLVLSGLEELSPETAAALAPQGDLRLRLPPNTPPETLQPLTGGSRLTLMGVDDPTPELLEVVAKAAGGLELPDVVTIQPAAARALAANANAVELPGLKKLPLEVAQAFGDGKAEWLTLDGIEEISPEAVAAIRRNRKRVCFLRGLRTLSPGVAKALVGMPVQLEFNDLESLDAETAAALAKHNNSVMLRGLRRLDPDAVRSLLGQRQYLEVHSREPLSTAAAEALSGRRARMVISIPGLDAEAARTLTAGLPRPKSEPFLAIKFSAQPADEPLEILAAHPAIGIHVEDLTRLSLAAARALAARENCGLQFQRLAELSPEVATALVTDNTDWLAFGGLKTLSPDLAKILARHRSDLQFSGLETLDREAALALADHTGSLMVGLRRIGPDLARALARHRGPLLLDLLTGLDAATAAALVGGPEMISFNSLRTIDADTAQALAAHDGIVALNCLESLPPEVAEPLFADRPAPGGDRRPDVQLNLDLLTGLTPRLAEALVRRAGDQADTGAEFSFPAVARLDSPAVADALAATRVRLAIPVLRQASPEVLGRLRTNPLIELPALDTIELLPNSDGSNDDFAVPD